MPAMRYPEHVLVVVACTLAGGVERIPLPHIFESFNTRNGTKQTCGSGNSWLECGSLDEQILPIHIYIPWVFTLCVMIVLSMPTVLLRSRHKRKALRHLSWSFLQCLVLAYCSIFQTDHPSLMYTFSLHSCIRLLVRMHVSDRLVGGSWWWGLRHVGAFVLIVFQVFVGVPVSVVGWEGARSGQQELTCAYLAHLYGCLLPDLVLFLMDTLVSAGSCLWMGEDY